MMAGLSLCLIGVLITRLYYLQVIEHEKHLAVSNQNRIDVRSIRPKRGLIFDRNNVLIAENQPSFTLMLIPEEVVDKTTFLSTLQKFMTLTPDQIKIVEKMQHIPRRPFEPIILKDRLSDQEIAKIVVNQHRLPGIRISAELRRHYPFKEIAAHVLGFVGLISPAERDELDPSQRGITHTGKKGVEFAYESSLRGMPGHEFIETNARGRLLKTLETHPATAGMDLQLSIDIRLQQATFQALQNFKRAAVVAIEPATGDVLAMVSVPSYNPNDFVSGISQNKYNQLLLNPARPLFNRTVQGQYPPGSTIKPMIALAALALDKTDWNTTIWDPGFYQLKGRATKYRDWKRQGHGRVDLERALVESCDTFFYSLGASLSIDNIHEQMRAFNFDQVTGIDLAGERKGLFPSSTWKQTNLKQPWYPGETLIAMIGQGYVLSTPLQLAQATAILANRGHRPQPRLVKATRAHGSNTSWTKLETFLKEPEIQVSEDSWDKTILAMQKVIDTPNGTGYKISSNLPYTLAGKTGTAQVVAIAQDAKYDPDNLKEEHLDHALFVGFAPIESPQIAIAVIIENGGGGGSVAAPVARQILDAYFKLQQPSTKIDGKQVSSTTQF